ncbi:aggrecan core protein, partial [Elysia marginata]
MYRLCGLAVRHLLRDREVCRSIPGGVKPRALEIDIEEAFEAEPDSKNATLGGFAMLRCKAPAGKPAPTISWLKDGLPARGTLLPEGHLLFNLVTKADQGYYKCIAENKAGRQESREIFLGVQATVPVKPISGGDGGVTPGEGDKSPDEETTTPGVIVLPGGDGTEGDTSTGEGGKMKEGEISPVADGLETETPTDRPVQQVSTYGPKEDSKGDDGMPRPDAEPSASTHLEEKDGAGISSGVTGGIVDESVPEGEPTRNPEPEISPSSVDGSKAIPIGEPDPSPSTDDKPIPEGEPDPTSSSGIKDDKAVPEGEPEPTSSSGMKGDKAVPEGEPDPTSSSGMKDDKAVPEGKPEPTSSSGMKGDKAVPEGEPDPTSSSGVKVEKVIPEGEPEPTSSSGMNGDKAMPEGEPKPSSSPGIKGDKAAPEGEPEPTSTSGMSGNKVIAE